MMDFLPEVVQFNIPFIFVLLITSFAAGLSYLLYRQTNPGNSSFVRTFLATLRTVLLIILLVLFFKPKLLLQFFETKQKNVALLIDHSASMAWEDDHEKRVDSVKIAMSKVENIFSGYDVNLNKLYFNQTIIKNTDSLKMPFGTTNFENAFDFLKASAYEMVILVSDGIRTEGILPQMNYMPVYTVGLGKKSSFPDVFITDVEYNPVIYQDKEQVIKVKISSNNVPESTAKLFIYHGNKLLANKNITITKNGVEQGIEFSFKVKQDGLQRFKVEIKPETEDSNSQNNSFVYSQEVLKNKIRIGIFSSVPNNEHKFLKFLLSKSENIETYSYLKIKNRPSENFSIDSLDVLILQGYPGKVSSQAEINNISSSLKRNKQGLINFLDDYTDIEKLSLLGMSKIVDGISRREKPISVTVLPVQLNNLLLRLNDDPEITDTFFNSVPPLSSYFELNNLKSDTQLLIKGISGGINDNSMMVNEGSDHKIILMNGAGFWRWHFSLQRDDKIKNSYQNLLTNMIRFTANKNKFQPVVLNINKKTTHPGQEILFDGRLFDTQNNPIVNGQLVINAQYENQKFEIPMEADSSGGFQASYTPVNEGNYLFTARGITDGKEIGNDYKSIIVIPYNREFIRTTQDSSFLRLLSEVSGGKYYTLNTIDSLKNHIAVSNTQILVKDEIELRFKSWLLYFIIIVAVAEWAFRKKNNLP